ncbi:cupin domain-containing protein [Flavihumibacter solisilvae]|uniref:cupin domain-containing protein n=1 Tax=Flavihumibacter solisilvae TaxID=1349421 RepID=UPI00068CDABE|nr:cupin domain-containing protein [Flavihumibacter solisilvae]
MAYRNKSISNKPAGVDINFLQTSKDTNGALLEVQATYHPRSKEPVVHYHPVQTELFTVISGELTVRLSGKPVILKQGEQLEIKPKTVHSMWNNSCEQTVVNWKVQPAMNTEYFMETTAGLATEGKTDPEGMPGILQSALMANHFSREFRMATLPFPIQQIAFIFLVPLAILFGYKAVYSKYVD